MNFTISSEKLSKYGKKAITYFVLLSGFWFSTVRPAIKGAIRRVVEEELLYTNTLLFSIADSAEIAAANKMYLEIKENVPRDPSIDKVLYAKLLRMRKGFGDD